MRAQPSPTAGRLGPLAAVLAVATVMMAGIPASGFHNDYPILLEETVEGNGAWVVAIRSDDTLKAPFGNPMVLVVEANAPQVASTASVGMFELDGPEAAPPLEAYYQRGVVAAKTGSSDRLLIDPIGDFGDPVSQDDNLTLSSSDGESTFLAWRQHLSAGEWRYAVFWAGGGETTTFQVRGVGIHVEALVKGQSHVMGTDELIHNGVRVAETQRLETPSEELPTKPGATVSLVENSTSQIIAEDPLIGAFTEFDMKYICAAGCVGYGSALDSLAGRAIEDGLSKISYVDPRKGQVSNPFDSYWMHPGTTVSGAYEFRVDRFVDGGITGGPVEENLLVLSVAEVDLTKVACPWPERSCETLAAVGGSPQLAPDQPAVAVAPPDDPQPTSRSCEDHPPIRISGDEGPLGIILGHAPSGEPIYRPGSGVVAGEGTAQDPYVLAGWCITSPPSRGVGVDIPPVQGQVGPLAGIQVEGTGSHLVIRANVVDGARIGTNGIALQDVENVTVADNTVTDHEFDGVEVHSSAGVSLKDNGVFDNGGHGVIVQGSADTHVEDNQLLQNGGDGVRAMKSVETVIADNTASGNTRGVNLIDSADALVVGNAITGNRDDGIQTDESSAIVITGNSIRDNDDGVVTSRSSGVVVTNNEVTGHWDGAFLDFFSTGTRFVNNIVEANPGSGFLAWGSTDVVFARNDVTDNGFVGVSLWQTTHSSVENNTIVGNADHGVRLYEATGDRLANNTIADNGFDGVALDLSEGISVKDNVISGHEIGIRVRDGGDHAFHRNNIEDNAPVGQAALDVSTHADARMNWWGCAGGPDDPSCNGVAGKVDYEPWLTAPNPEAGVG